MEGSPHPSILLSARGLGHGHEHGTGFVFRDLDLDLREGELVHLRGDNGSGKTSLLRLLSGELLPTMGRILVLGLPLGPGPDEGRQHLAYVPDSLRPSPWLSPTEYLRLRASWRGASGPELDSRVAATLADWDLERLRDRPIATFSFGEMRRTVLAAALSTRPRILLLDEPLNGLDRRHRSLAMERLAEASRGSAVLATTHLERGTLEGATRSLLLEDGRLS